jgi:protocatechuate 3,4-dioxygenase, beta subunit
MARLVLPARLALKRPDGSSSEALLAKVVFTMFLYFAGADGGDTMLSRRNLFQASAALVVAGALPTKLAVAQATSGTPGQILGPFYPVMRTMNETGDLTRVPGKSGRAEGQILDVTGTLRNGRGEPLRGAKIEVWQANALGRYAHPSDRNPAPLDPNFEGFGVVTTDHEGSYRFKTIKPAAYPIVGTNMIRPAHIHFDIMGRTDRIVTQMYFEGDPHNDKDRFLQSVARPERLIARSGPLPADAEAGSQAVVFDLVLPTG